jgi:hypothetical protein
MNPDLNIKTPKDQLSDEQVQALLAVNKLQVKDVNNHASSFLAIVISVTILVVVLSLVLSYKNGLNAKTSFSPKVSSSSPFNSNSSIDQQVKYCSNVINAQTSC